MDDVLNGAPQQEPKVEGQPEQVEQSNEQQEGQGEPTSPDTERNVPLAALEAERKGRQDWKEKAIRYEEELKQLRNPQPQQPQRELHPMEAMQQQVINERFNTSELIARQAYKDLDEKVEVFMEAAKANPALAAALQQQRHPWDFAYREGARMLLQKEMGDDPNAYKDRLRAELEAEILQKHGITSGSPAAPRPVIPGSLAGARSAASRSSPGYTGPTPLTSVIG